MEHKNIAGVAVVLVHVGAPGAAADDQLAVLAGVVEQGDEVPVVGHHHDVGDLGALVDQGHGFHHQADVGGVFAVTRGAVGNVEMVNLVRLQHPADAVGVERRPRQAGDIAKRAFDLDAPVVLAQMLQHRRDVHGHAHVGAVTGKVLDVDENGQPVRGMRRQSGGGKQNRFRCTHWEWGQLCATQRFCLSGNRTTGDAWAGYPLLQFRRPVRSDPGFQMNTGSDGP